MCYENSYANSKPIFWRQVILWEWLPSIDFFPRRIRWFQSHFTEFIGWPGIVESEILLTVWHYHFLRCWHFAIPMYKSISMNLSPHTFKNKSMIMYRFYAEFRCTLKPLCFWSATCLYLLLAAEIEGKLFWILLWNGAILTS